MKITKKAKISIVAVYFMICTAINFVKFLPEFMEGLSQVQMSSYHMVLAIAYMIIMSFIAAILVNIFPIIIVTIVYLARRRVKKDSLSKIDIKKYFGYYRDMLSEYSPAVLSYVDDLTVEPKKDIVATILGLKLKKKIDIIDGNIQVIDSSEDGLENNEKYILKNGLDNCNEFTFENLVKDDARNKGIIQRGRKLNAKSIITLLMVIALVIAINVVYFKFLSGTVINVPNGSFLGGVELAVLVIGGIFFAFSPVGIVVYILSYVSSVTKSNNTRTDKGEEVNEKLEGLKNYIKDYSNLDEKSENDLTLWEDYLIYSVIFGQNTEIVKRIYK